MRPQHITEEDFKVMVNRVRRDAQGNGERGHGTRVTNHSVGDPSPKPIYASKWDANFASKLEMEQKAGLIKAWVYERHTFKMAHRQYHRSDFLIWHLDNSIEIAQVKGYHKNLRAAMKGLKWAAQLNPWFVWTVKRWTGGEWRSELVEV